MTDKHPDTLRNKNQGLLGKTIFACLKIIVSSLLAWLCLTLWFTGKAILYGQVSALYSAQQIANENLLFIKQHPAYLTNAFVDYVDKLQQLTETLLEQISEWNITLLTFTSNLLLNITAIQLTRLLIFIMALPLFIVILVIAVIDGLVKRDIRKFQGARESSLIFHRIKSLIGFCFFIPFCIYLSLPFALNPLLILLPQIISMGWAVALSITYFKKYV